MFYDYCFSHRTASGLDRLIIVPGNLRDALYSVHDLHFFIFARKNFSMPIYMDIHSVPGVKSRDVAEAHRQDLMHQEEYGCNCMTYWIDEDRESIFCLIEAANKDAVKAMHQKSHGLLPHKIIEVSSALVQSFLGRMYDPDDAFIDNGLKVFADPAYRLLLMTTTDDHALIRHKFGTEKANDLLYLHNAIVRKNISLHSGSEAEHTGEGFVISFTSAANAIACALAIKNDMTSVDAASLNYKMALNGGEPIEKSNGLFGDTMQTGHYFCLLTTPSKVAIAGKIKDLISKELLYQKKEQLFMLSLPDEDFMHALFTRLEKNFHEPAFDVPEYAQALSLSQPQLYRKTTALTGMSLNNLLKEFRLMKAKELLKSLRYSVSQVTFDTGFTSPSYFTKCFKARYDLLPMEYLELIKKSTK
jgi:AraC-like DNA-binding protein